MDVAIDVISMSSKGQVVLPKKIRDEMTLESGTKFAVFTDGKNIYLKPIKIPSLEEFNAMMDESQKWAEEVGLTEDDITDAIREVRRKHRADENRN